MSSEQKRREKELAAQMETLYRKMSPQQRLFIDSVVLHWNDIETGKITRAELYMRAYPRCTNTNLAIKSISRMTTGSERPAQYMDLYLESVSLKTDVKKLRSIEDTMVDLERMATADILSLCSFRIVEDGNGGTIPIPMMMDPNEVPTEIRRLIKGVTFTKNGPKLELHDQLRAQEMLLKMRGAFTERRQVELTGAGGGAIQIEGEIKVTVETVVKNLLENL